MSAMSSLFPTLSAGPPGFALVEDVLTASEETSLLAWARDVPLEPYVMHDTPSRRRVASFGVTYRLGQRRVEPRPLPAELLGLAERCAAIGGVDPATIAQALVSRYPAGAGIGWHRDRALYGPVVLGVSLAASCRLRLREAAPPPAGRRRVITVTLPPRSVYVLGGPARADWEHAIPPVEVERWSVTLRTLRSTPSPSR